MKKVERACSVGARLFAFLGWAGTSPPGLSLCVCVHSAENGERVAFHSLSGTVHTHPVALEGAGRDSFLQVVLCHSGGRRGCYLPYGHSDLGGQPRVVVQVLHNDFSVSPMMMAGLDPLTGNYRGLCLEPSRVRLFEWRDDGKNGYKFRPLWTVEHQPSRPVRILWAGLDRHGHLNLLVPSALLVCDAQTGQPLRRTSLSYLVHAPEAAGLYIDGYEVEARIHAARNTLYARQGKCDGLSDVIGVFT